MTHVYFFYAIRVKPKRTGLDVPTAEFRDAVQRALNAEGVPIQQWQRMPVPAQNVFQVRLGYGKGCPWSCPHARPVEYRPSD